MSPAACDPVVEVCCESGRSPAGGWIWFRCAYDGCHSGVGHIIIESKAGEILYEGCPTEGTSKLTWIDFPGAAKLWEGGLMQVNYGLPGCSESGHVCNRATFEWGSYEDTVNPLGVAYLDNAGGENDRGNVCDGAALEIWRSVSRGNTPQFTTSYIDVTLNFPVKDDALGDSGSNYPDQIVGPYDRSYWMTSGNLAVDDDLMLDGLRVYANGNAGPVGGSNAFLGYLQAGRTARFNVWNGCCQTGTNNGALRLYEATAVTVGSSRCNAFIILPNTIGAIQLRLPVAGQRKVCYRRAGVPAVDACLDALRVPDGYKPKIIGVSVGLPSGPLTATAHYVETTGLPEQVPLAKRALLTAAERWDVEIFRNGSSDDYFSLVLFFPSEGYQGGMIEVGAAINYTDSYASEVVRVGQNATLRISSTYYE